MTRTFTPFAATLGVGVLRRDSGQISGPGSSSGRLSLVAFLHGVAYRTDACLNEHWFESLAQARQVIERWRVGFNTQRPRGASGTRIQEQYAVEVRRFGGSSTPQTLFAFRT